MSPGPPQENDTARNARREMNLILSDVIESVDLIGIPRTVYYTPPPAIGGYAGHVDLMGSLFQLWQFHIEPQMAQDVLERAIGVYLTQARRLFWQCFNPFFWLERLLVEVLAVPFRILAAAGFNAGRIEHSFVGKFAKAVFAFVGFVAAILASLHYLGLLGPVRDFVNALFGRRG